MSKLLKFCPWEPSTHDHLQHYFRKRNFVESDSFWISFIKKKGNYPINLLLTGNILWVISGKMLKTICLYLSWVLRKLVLKFAISNHFLVKSGKSLYILYKWVNLAFNIFVHNFFPFMCIKKSFYIHNLHSHMYNVCTWHVHKPNNKKVINICLGTVFFRPTLYICSK